MWKNINTLSQLNISDAPNILLYGAYGFPHQKIIEEFIADKFNVKLPIAKRKPAHTGIPYIETDYYIEIDFFHPDFSSDIHHLTEFLLTICQHRCLHMARHIIVLRNIDFFHRNNSQYIRVLFERFYKNVFFICTTCRINKIEAPIQSRMQMYRVPLVNRPVLKHTELNAFIKKPSFEQCRLLAYKLYQHNIELRMIIRELINSNSDLEFIKQMTDIEHRSLRIDESKIVFYIEYALLTFVKAASNRSGFALETG